METTEGDVLRDEGLQRVSRNPFISSGLQVVREIEPAIFEITGEEIRQRVTAKNIWPHHHNAWGALIMAAIREKLIKPTGICQKSRGAAAHSRKNAVYTLLTCLTAVVMLGCTVPLVPVSEQWKWPTTDTPLANPSPAVDWQGGFMGGPVHE